MGSFGDRLRREREMRGITLNEISESTKISRRHLESLETEDFESLPGGIFNKGFVRAYARFLGIDEEQAVADYAVASNEPMDAEDKFPLEIHEQPDPQLNPKRSSLPLIVALLALLAVLAVFWARNKTRSMENSDNATTPAAARTPASPVQTSPSPEPETPAPTPSTSTPATQTSPPAAVRNTSDTVASVAKPSANEHTFSVMVTAKESAWVSLTADGKVAISKILRAGERETVRAGSRVVLITGNAGGVDVSFNGKLLPAVGSEAEVRTLTFTAAGLVQ